MSNARNLGNITTGGATGATTASVTTSINNLVDGSPGALDTLNELSAALGDDANFSTTVTNNIATKLPLAGGTLTGNLTMENTDAGSAAGPEFVLFRNSASAADADYLGQIKFDGKNDAGQSIVYAKITGKILDASDGTEDGIIEIAHKKAGSNNISARFRSDSLQLINGTNLTVAGTTDLTGDLTVDTNTLHVSTSNNSVGIGTTSPDDKLHIEHSDTGTYSASSLATGMQVSRKNSSNTNNQAVTLSLVATGWEGITTGLAGISAVQPSNTSSADLVFQNRSGGGYQENMRIKYDGKVGIGTASPDRALHIEGSDFASSTIRLKRTGGGANNDAGLQFQSAAGANTDTGLGGIWFQNSLDGNAYALIRARTDDGTGTSGRLDFMTSTSIVNNTSTPSLTIKSSGNVGIGTTNPFYKLQIDQGTTAQYVTSFRNTADNLQLVVGTTTGGLINIQGKTINSGAAYQIALQAEGGNVGIGTTNPATKLDIRFSGRDGINVGSTTGAGAFIVLDGAGNGDAAGGDYAYIEHKSDGNLAFNVGNASNSTNTKFTIEPGGNVGVGLDNPSYKLDVGGVGATQLRLKSSGDTGYTQGAMIIESSASSSNPGNRGQGVYYYNVPNQRTWYTGTLYNNGNKFGFGYRQVSGFQADAADNLHAMMVLDGDNGNVGIGGSPSRHLSIIKANARMELTDNTNQLNIGLWDGTNYRIEGDANRPLFITSYHSNGVALGQSGSTNMQVSTGGVEFLPNSSGSFNFKSGGNPQLSIKTGQFTGASGVTISTSNIQIVNSAFGALVFVAAYGISGSTAQFCDLVYFGYNASPTIIAQQTIVGSPPTRYYTGSGYALYLRYSSGNYTTKVNYIQSHS